MSTPAVVCLRTTSATADRMRAARAAGSTDTPSSFANIVWIRSSGRGRLPVCVVRKRSLVRFIGVPLEAARLLPGGRVHPELKARGVRRELEPFLHRVELKLVVDEGPGRIVGERAHRTVVDLGPLTPVQDLSGIFDGLVELRVVPLAEVPHALRVQGEGERDVRVVVLQEPGHRPQRPGRRPSRSPVQSEAQARRQQRGLYTSLPRTAIDYTFRTL